jgi:putative hydrolase of the HAD superfamily
MAILATIWDMGGVIVRTEERTSRQQMAARMGMSYEDLTDLVFYSQSAYLASLGKITTIQHWDTVRTTLKLPDEEFARVPDEFWGGDRLDIDLVNSIRSLRPHYKTALLSNAWDDLRDMLVNRWQISDAFDQIIISAEVGVMKPDPRIYQIALERLQVKPSEAVFIDDFEENLEGARNVGLQTIHFRSPAQALAELRHSLAQ